MAPSENEAAAKAEETATGPALVAAVLAWAIPGAGHLYLKRRGRALLFCILILASVVIGVALDGKLWHTMPNQPLSTLGTLGSMGMGLPYLVLRYAMSYQGDPVSAGYEYGGAFLLTAGLMNLLLILDAWDIARGKKE